jgi:hypothetical protein
VSDDLLPPLRDETENEAADGLWPHYREDALAWRKGFAHASGELLLQGFPLTSLGRNDVPEGTVKRAVRAIRMMAPVMQKPVIKARTWNSSRGRLEGLQGGPVSSRLSPAFWEGRSSEECDGEEDMAQVRAEDAGQVDAEEGTRASEPDPRAERRHRLGRDKIVSIPVRPGMLTRIAWYHANSR